MCGKSSGLNAALEEFAYHSDTCSSKCKTIGIVIPTEVNPIYPDLADKLKRIVRSFGLTAFVCNAQNSLQREALCVSLLKSNVSGIIAMPICDDSYELYAELGIPTVLLGCRTHKETLGYVAMDNERAGQLAAERLLLYGHRKLAFLTYPVHSIAYSDRLKGFSDAVRTCDGAKLHVVNTAAGIRLEESYQAVLQLLISGDPPTAIAAADDFLAIGAWQALREKNLPVGSEYALIGFGNTPFAALPKHGLSSVGPDADLAGIAVQLLLDIQNGETSAPHRILPPQLVSRSTF